MLFKVSPAFFDVCGQGFNQHILPFEEKFLDKMKEGQPDGEDYFKVPKDAPYQSTLKSFCGDTKNYQLLQQVWKLHQKHAQKSANAKIIFEIFDDCIEVLESYKQIPSGLLPPNVEIIIYNCNAELQSLQHFHTISSDPGVVSYSKVVSIPAPKYSHEPTSTPYSYITRSETSADPLLDAPDLVSPAHVSTPHILPTSRISTGTLESKIDRAVSAEKREEKPQEDTEAASREKVQEIVKKLVGIYEYLKKKSQDCIGRSDYIARRDHFADYLVNLKNGDDPKLREDKRLDSFAKVKNCYWIFKPLHSQRYYDLITSIPPAEKEILQRSVALFVGILEKESGRTDVRNWHLIGNLLSKVGDKKDKVSDSPKNVDAIASTSISLS